MTQAEDLPLRQPANSLRAWLHALVLRFTDREAWEKESEWMTGRYSSVPETKIHGPIKRIRWVHPRTGLRWENDWIT